jgi:hypothetical protein
MKQYLLSVHMIEGQEPPAPETMQQMYNDVEAVNGLLQAEGAWVFAGGLYPPDSATVVRLKDGEVLTTDGPFAETKEHLGGFWVIKAADLDAALAWASKATKACQAPVEVRPFQDEPGQDEPAQEEPAL